MGHRTYLSHQDHSEFSGLKGHEPRPSTASTGRRHWSGSLPSTRSNARWLAIVAPVFFLPLVRHEHFVPVDAEADMSAASENNDYWNGES
jgi:hypothetical protein